MKYLSALTIMVFHDNWCIYAWICAIFSIINILDIFERFPWVCALLYRISGRRNLSQVDYRVYTTVNCIIFIVYCNICQSKQYNVWKIKLNFLDENKRFCLKSRSFLLGQITMYKAVIQIESSHKSDFFSLEKDLFSITRAQNVLSYHPL